MRAIAALLLIAAAVAAVAYLAGHPGQVTIVWQGWQIDTSVGVLIGAAALVTVAGSALALLAAALRRLPRDFRRRRAARRRRAGEAALSRGLIALAVGRPAEAARHGQRAASLLDGAPVPLLLAAEAAARQGNADAARRAYTQLLERPDGEFLGLRGLIGQALQAGDDGTARRLAERAQQLRPDAGWLIETLLGLEARAGDWPAARATLAAAARRRVLPAERARHHRGVVLHALSRAAERRGEVRQAAKLAARAQAAAPDLAAVAVDHARLLLVLGRRRAAARAIERAWRTAPQPDLAHLYVDLDPDAVPLARAAAAQRLAGQNPQANESHLAVAEAALEARLWGEARRHLGLAMATEAETPLRRLCLLMARLEEGERGDAHGARAWLDRAVGGAADPAHVCTACGGIAAAWLPLCPRCGGFDTLVWRRPPAEAVGRIGPAVESGAPPVLPAPELPGSGGRELPPA